MVVMQRLNVQGGVARLPEKQTSVRRRECDSASNKRVVMMPRVDPRIGALPATTQRAVAPRIYGLVESREPGERPVVVRDFIDGIASMFYCRERVDYETSLNAVRIVESVT